MVDSDTNGKSTGDSGIKSVQDNLTELRILPYYCSWYRRIFTRDTSESPVAGSENSVFRTTND
jgi:hypothetical protein